MHSPVPHHSFIHSFAHSASRQRTPAGRLGTNVPRATAGHQGWRRRVARVSRTGAHTPCKPSSEQTHLSVPRRGHSDVHGSGVHLEEVSVLWQPLAPQV